MAEPFITVGGEFNGGAVLGVAADEVVHAVTAVADLGQQALAVQGVQVIAGLPQADTGQGGGGVDIDRGAGVQAEAAEEPSLAGDQIPVGHVKRGGDAIFLRREGEHARLGLADEVSQGPGRVPGVHPGQQRNRQRQVPGQPE